ncbi:LOW QUALITY PROTEIN: protein UXT [Harpia harpyja]|uniref:LOW QUALITY PROTEIN: protein UXT n=1 Tax=Harpia harpyja TaxID=202280 RepID=UPI0022B12AE7|nr:LOW QUALITY PROTEIN: protein UXT [Harpia harpyja]
MAAAGKAQRYEAFVSDVLQRDLRRVQEQRDGIFEQQAQVLQLRTALARLQEAPTPLRTQVDLGCNFFVTAEVPSPQRVFVALGYGFFAELTLPEALRHLDRRSRLLDRLSESLTRDGAKIRAHIRLVLEGLRELQGLQDPPTTSDP